MSTVLRKLLILPPIALGFGVLYLSAAQRATPERAEAQEVATVARFIETRPRAVTPRVLGYGVVSPARSWTAAPQVDGRVAYVSPNFVKGGTVAKGETLIRIAPEEYALAVAQAEAEIAAAEAQIEEKRQSETATQSSLAIERQSLELAERELTRQRELASRGSAAAATADTQERAVLTQKSAVQNLQNQLDLIPAQLKSLEQSLAVQRARLANAKLDLDRAEIAAPFSARVSEADVEVSQYAAVGAKLGVLDGVAEAEVEAQIALPKMRDFARMMVRRRANDAPLPENLGIRLAEARVERGLHALVRLAFADQPVEWRGRVERVSATIDPETRAVGVIVAVDDPYSQNRDEVRPPLIKGLFVEVELRADPIDGLTPVPRAAIRDGSTLVANADDRLARRQVTVAATIGDMALVRSGLEPGDRVIVSTLSPAVEGMLLKPVRDEAAEARLATAASGEGPAR